MMGDTDREALLRAVQDNPDDLDRQSVYGDCLEESGEDPERLDLIRTKFEEISLQKQLAVAQRRAALAEAVFRENCNRDWPQKIDGQRDYQLHYDLLGGFVNSLTGSSQAVAAALNNPRFSREAVSNLSLSRLMDDSLDKLPQLSQIKNLCVDFQVRNERAHERRDRFIDAPEAVFPRIICLLKSTPNITKLTLGLAEEAILSSRECNDYAECAQNTLATLAASTTHSFLKEIRFPSRLQLKAHWSNAEPYVAANIKEAFLQAHRQALEACLRDHTPMPLPALETPMNEGIKALREQAKAEGLDKLHQTDASSIVEATSIDTRQQGKKASGK